MLMQLLRVVAQAFADVLRPAGSVLIQSLALVLNPALVSVVRPTKQAGKEAGLDQRLQELSDSMRKSAELIAEVEAALEVRQAAVAQLKSEAETAQRIAELSEVHRKAVQTLLRGTVAKEGRKTFWLGALVNLVFFALGVVVTLVVGK